MRRVALGLALAAFLCAPTASASPEAERAVALGREAHELYASGRYQEAYERFVVADRMAHSTVFVFYMARCKRNTGRLLEARRLFERAAREPLAEDATEPMQRARADASEELAAVSPRIPRVVVRVEGAPAGAHVGVAIDGSPATAGQIVEIDPGRHRFEANAAGARARRSVDLAEGAPRLDVVLTLRASASSEPARGSIAPGLLALGVGAAGLGVGSVTGLITATEASRVKDGCESNHCLRTDAEAADSARSLATVSTVAFVVGGAGVATGIVLLAVRPGGAAPQTTATFSAGPGALRVGGTF